MDGSISPSVGNFLNLTETVFSLRFDLNNFYIRSNVDYQAGHPGPQFWSTSVNALSTKKYLLDSYSWSNLLSVKQYWEYLKSHDGDWFFQRIDSKKVYQIHLFSLKESNQRSWKYFLDGKKLLKLFTNNRAFFEFCHFEHFDWLAFKEHRVKSIPKARKISSSKTVVTIFADSLDRRIFDIEYMKYFLPNLFRLRNKSVLFRGFTSSASWTYPVLSSIYSGINSAIDLRLWRNSWLLDIFNEIPLEYIEPKEVRQLLLRKKLHKHHITSEHSPFLLTKNLSKEVNVYGLKNSMNHSWRHGMSSYYTTSMEKSGFNSFNSLNEASEVLLSSNMDKVVFLDLDHAHRHTIPKTNYPKYDGEIPYNDLEFLKSMVMPEQTLTGNIGSDKVSIYLRRYQIDRSLGAIIQFFGDNTSFILFSDHGSSFVDHISATSETQHDRYNMNKSSVSLNKVATPTLLYSSCSNGTSATSSELVSSQDIFDIIQYLMLPNYEQ